MTVTHAQSLAEAVEILDERRKKKNRIAGQKKSFEHPSLKQQFASALGRQRMLSVTLSDRVVQGPMVKVNSHRNRPKLKRAEPWSRERVRESYATGYFKTLELARRANVSVLQIGFWIRPPDWRPIEWRCSHCRKLVRNNTTATDHEPECPRCGTPWDFGLQR